MLPNLKKNLKFCSPSGQELDQNIKLVWGNSALANYSNKLSLSEPPEVIFPKEAFLSFGLKDNHKKIVAQAAIALHPWGEAELGGAVVLPEFRGQGLMSKINEKRSKILLKLEKAGYRIITYATVGTPAMLYSDKLLSFQKFTGHPINIAPFVIPGNPLKLTQNISQLYPSKSSIFIYKNKVSTAQFVAVNPQKPLRFKTKMKFWSGKKYLSQLPTTYKIDEQLSFKENLLTPVRDFKIIDVGTDTQFGKLPPQIKNDETYLIRVPLIPAFDFLQQQLLKNKTIIAGLAVTQNNHLSLVHAKLSANKLRATKSLIKELSKSKGQVGKLAQALFSR